MGTPRQFIDKREGAYLPHWRAKEAIYFVTYRLAGSLPSDRMKEIDSRRQEIFSNAERFKMALTSYQEDELENLHFRKLDLARYDRGSKFLQDDRIAEIVKNGFQHFEGKRYELFAWSIMPNHIHIVLQPLGNEELSTIVHSWKSFTAKEANKILKTTGPFWQEQYYDHLIRNEADLERCIEYTWKNSDEAGLKNWKWRWKCNMQIHHDIATHRRDADATQQFAI